MKKVLASVVALGCFAAAGSALAGLPAGTGVNGSLHDMNAVVQDANHDQMGRVCVFCHTPHHATKDAVLDSYPLWNHKLVDVNGYPAYTWATPANYLIEGSPVISNPLAGPSRLCMSCHDGSIAIDQHGNAQGWTKGQFGAGGGTTIADRAKLSGENDLTTTHPIGFDYKVAAQKRNEKAGNGSASAGGATEIVPDNYGFATGITKSETAGTYNVVTRNDKDKHKLIGDVLFQGNIMTCASCHEVHNKENVTQKNYEVARNGNTTSQAPNYFLYAQEDQSLICLSCHVK